MRSLLAELAIHSGPTINRLSTVVIGRQFFSNAAPQFSKKDLMTSHQALKTLQRLD